MIQSGLIDKKRGSPRDSFRDLGTGHDLKKSFEWIMHTFASVNRFRAICIVITVTIGCAKATCREEQYTPLEIDEDWFFGEESAFYVKAGTVGFPMYSAGNDVSPDGCYTMWCPLTERTTGEFKRDPNVTGYFPFHTVVCGVPESCLCTNDKYRYMDDNNHYPVLMGGKRRSYSYLTKTLQADIENYKKLAPDSKIPDSKSEIVKTNISLLQKRERS